MIGQYTEQSIVTYVENREEAFRVEAMDIVRLDPSLRKPWGLALLYVLKEFNHFWQDDKERLIPLSGPAIPRAPLPIQRPGRRWSGERCR